MYHRALKLQNEIFAQQIFQVGSDSEESAEKFCDCPFQGQSSVNQPTGFALHTGCFETFGATVRLS